jgi:hypothetical protein
MCTSAHIHVDDLIGGGFGPSAFRKFDLCERAALVYIRAYVVCLLVMLT